MASVDLAARKATLQASRRLELRAAWRRGELVERGAVDEAVHRRLYAARAAALALPTKVAPRLAGADAARAAKLVREEVAEMLEDLDQPLRRDLGPPPLRGDPRPWSPPMPPDDVIDYEVLERERRHAERVLDRCYGRCKNLAWHDRGCPKGDGLAGPYAALER